MLYLYGTKAEARRGLAYHQRKEPNKKFKLVHRKREPNKGFYEVRYTLGGSTRTQQLKQISIYGQRQYFRVPTKKALRRKKETGTLRTDFPLPKHLQNRKGKLGMKMFGVEL